MPSKQTPAKQSTSDFKNSLSDNTTGASHPRSQRLNTSATQIISAKSYNSQIDLKDLITAG
jgi:hypothetical protein